MFNDPSGLDPGIGEVLMALWSIFQNSDMESMTLTGEQFMDFYDDIANVADWGGSGYFEYDNGNLNLYTSGGLSYSMGPAGNRVTEGGGWKNITSVKSMADNPRVMDYNPPKSEQINTPTNFEWSMRNARVGFGNLAKASYYRIDQILNTTIDAGSSNGKENFGDRKEGKRHFKMSLDDIDFLSPSNLASNPNPEENKELMRLWEGNTATDYYVYKSDFKEATSQGEGGWRKALNVYLWSRTYDNFNGRLNVKKHVGTLKYSEFTGYASIYNKEGFYVKQFTKNAKLISNK